MIPTSLLITLHLFPDLKIKPSLNLSGNISIVTVSKHKDNYNRFISTIKINKMFSALFIPKYIKAIDIPLTIRLPSWKEQMLGKNIKYQNWSKKNKSWSIAISKNAPFHPESAKVFKKLKPYQEKTSFNRIVPKKLTKTQSIDFLKRK